MAVGTPPPSAYTGKLANNRRHRPSTASSMNERRDNHAMTGSGATAADRAFTLSVIDAAPGALWRDAREACDRALAQGLVFALILHEAEAFADDRLLDDVDRQRAGRFRRDVDRRNFVLGRTMVHHLVRAEGAPAPCVLSRGHNGKPCLSGCAAFNLSHSGRWVACAVSRSEPVGIDVEVFDRLQDYRELLASTTHSAERQCIAQAPPESRFALFKRCWTRKEAALKATGKGLADDLTAIDVRLAESSPVLDHPLPLRLVDLLADDSRVTVSLALDASIQGVVAMQLC